MCPFFVIIYMGLVSWVFRGQRYQLWKQYSHLRLPLPTCLFTDRLYCRICIGIYCVLIRKNMMNLIQVRNTWASRLCGVVENGLNVNCLCVHIVQLHEYRGIWNFAFSFRLFPLYQLFSVQYKLTNYFTACTPCFKCFWLR